GTANACGTKTANFFQKMPSANFGLLSTTTPDGTFLVTSQRLGSDWPLAYVYKWNPAGNSNKGCFGNAAGTCESATTKTNIWQTIPNYFSFPALFAQLSGTMHLIGYSSVDANTWGLGLFKATYPACSVAWSNTSGSGLFGSGAVGSIGTGNLTQTTTYTLTCSGIGSVQTTVNIASTPAVSVIAQDAAAAESPVDTGTFRITRAGSASVCGFGSSVGGGVCRGYLLSGTSWTVPSDWNSSNNSIEVIGGGGKGGDGTGSATARSGGGGGGGAYSAVSNVSLTLNTPVAYQIGSAGVGGTNAGNTYFCNFNTACASITDSSVVAGAEGGRNGTNASTAGSVPGGAGGLASNGRGTTKYDGGTGGASEAGAGAGGGGGGAAGPHGAGGNGANAVSTSGGSGGTGDNAFGGAGGVGWAPPVDGGRGTEWDSTHGSGGGGSGRLNTYSASGGLYGGGGGGGRGSGGPGGSGTQGLIVISYVPTTPGIDLSVDLPVIFSFAAGGANAVRTTDYTLSGGSITNPSGTTVVIPSGQQYVDVTVTPTQDYLYEGNEPVTLTIQSPGDSSYTVGAPASATVTITDAQTAASLPSGSFTACTGIAGGLCNLGVTPARVRSGSAVLVTWSVSGLITGANGKESDSCSIDRNPDDASFPIPWPQTGSTWVNTTGISSTITQPTTFKLSCTAPDGTPNSVSKTVTIVPSYQEI
ncbi:MAG TPA: hypothetical protein VHD55_02065, partial [Candidatus Paceibacterota bacterium]|nr:hypothetical protein [Candidatus Paceibacterota bacterium]